MQGRAWLRWLLGLASHPKIDFFDTFNPKLENRKRLNLNP